MIYVPLNYSLIEKYIKSRNKMPSFLIHKIVIANKIKIYKQTY